MIQSLVANSGVAGPYDLYVQQTAAPSMTVEVTAGAAFIYGTQLTNQGVYHCYNDAPEIVTIAPASGQYPRKDIVVLRVYDAEVSGIESTSRIEVVVGSASVVPLAPSVPANSLLLATVDVPAGASQISGVNILTNRVRAKSGLASDVDVVTSATRPALPYTGQRIFESDTKQMPYFDGSAWQALPHLTVTSTTRPLAGKRYTGQIIYETDTKRLLMFDGSYWMKIGGPREELQYQSDSGLTTASAGQNLIHINIDITVPTGIRANVHFDYVISIRPNAATSIAAWVILEVTGVQVQRVRYHNEGSGTQIVPIALSGMATLPGGTHTVTVRHINDPASGGPMVLGHLAGYVYI